MQPRDIRIRVESRFHREGSVIKGDASTVCDGVHVALDFVSDDTPERNQQLADMAESSCYAMSAVRSPVDCVFDVTVNGRAESR
jgi:hypothetical protein